MAGIRNPAVEEGMDSNTDWRGDVELDADFDGGRDNPCVGLTLLSENERVRVWSIHLKPGERIGFHRHVLDYFWTALSDGRGRSHLADGRTVETDYRAGDLVYERYGRGEDKIHDLQNVGDGDLGFVTVEFLNSSNPPLELPDDVKPAASG
jgi:quercetin dioxygenase-like cupin family protein